MVKTVSKDKGKDRVQSASTLLKKYKKKKTKVTISEPQNVTAEECLSPVEQTKQDAGVQKITLPKVMFEGMTMDEIGEKYPVLKDEQLVQRFLSVPMNNNQKGRVRQLLKDKLKGTSDILLPDVIYNKIQIILKSSENLTDTDLRKIRILYNMLKTSLKTAESPKKNDKKKTNVDKIEIENKKQEEKKETKEQLVKKVKGKKRYVVFIGNLPLDVNKTKIMNHFAELGDHIVDVRIPKREGKKSAIAYVEVANEPSYEMALSKHHSMLANKRINVLYTTQKNGKITKSEAKSKSAKLLALQKSGKLLGSVPMNRKRSHRRTKLKEARAKEEMKG